MNTGSMSERVRAHTGRTGAGYYIELNALAGFVLAPTPGQSVAAHDLQQTGMIGKTERFRRRRDVPVVALERFEQDSAFGLCLEGLECSRRSLDVGDVLAI